MFKELKEARSTNLKKSMKMIMTQFGVVINLLGGEVCEEVPGASGINTDNIIYLN